MTFAFRASFGGKEEALEAASIDAFGGTLESFGARDGAVAGADALSDPLSVWAGSGVADDDARR